MTLNTWFGLIFNLYTLKAATLFPFPWKSILSIQQEVMDKHTLGLGCNQVYSQWERQTAVFQSERDEIDMVADTNWLQKGFKARRD